MTVVQRIIDELNENADSINTNTDYDKGTMIGINAAANIVRRYLQAEEYEIRNAFIAGYASVSTNDVRLETDEYLAHLKTKA